MHSFEVMVNQDSEIGPQSCSVWNAFWCLELFQAWVVTHECDGRTNMQTDRLTDFTNTIANADLTLTTLRANYHSSGFSRLPLCRSDDDYWRSQSFHGNNLAVWPFDWFDSTLTRIFPVRFATITVPVRFNSFLFRFSFCGSIYGLQVYPCSSSFRFVFGSDNSQITMLYFAPLVFEDRRTCGLLAHQFRIKYLIRWRSCDVITKTKRGDF